MAEEQNEVPEKPATWENVVAGRTMEALGHVIGDKEMIADGEEEAEIAREVREEYREQN